LNGKRALPALLASVLLALFGARAMIGWSAGPAWSRGSRLAAAEFYSEALPVLDRAAVGARRSAALWLRGEARMGLWEQRLVAGEEAATLEGLLADAHRDYTEAIAMSPASGWYWASLGALYHEIERFERSRRSFDLSLLRRGPWAAVGRPGRIALGATRIAIEREPTLYTFHDQLALMFLEYGLNGAALEAVRRSARAQPIYEYHDYRSLDPTPRAVEDAFAQACRASLGRTPFLRRCDHLLALGRLELRRGRASDAERDLRAALEAPGHELNRAEGHYLLGLALLNQGRHEEAEQELLLAEAHPRFEAAAVAARARIADGQGRREEALDLLRRARRLRPRELAYVLEFARIAREAGEWKMAEEALRWGISVYPEDPRAWRSLLGTSIELGRWSEAEQALRELERLEGPTETVLRFREIVERTGSR
jgi:tetratricopeptide (TPR) repeat protein